MTDGVRLRVLLCACLCVLQAACSTKAERIESGLQKGRQYLAASDWDKASIEARNVLQMDPKNAEAFLIAASVDDGKSAFRNAYADYTKALELKPASVDAKLGLARLYLLSGDVDKASALIAGVLAGDAGNPRAQTLDAALHARQGDKDGAIARADRVVKDGQALPAESSLTLAGLYFNAGAFGPALDVLDRGAAAHPQDGRLLEMAAEIAQSGNPDDARVTRAVGYYTRATDLAPTDDALWRGWAAMHLRRKETAQAEAVLRKAVQVAPDIASRQVALLQFMAAFHDPKQAQEAYQAAIDAHPRQVELRFALADFYLAQKRRDDAVGVLQAIVADAKGAPAGATARGRLAAMWIEEGKVAPAKAILAELLKANPRDAAGLVLRGRMEIAEGDTRDAVIDLRAAAKDRPGSLEVAALLARAHHLAGEPELAREALADAVKFNGDDPGAHLMLAADMAQTKEFPAAISEVDQAIKVDPKGLRAHEMKVEMLIASGDFASSEAAAQEIETRFPTEPAGHLLHGRALSREKKTAAALAQFDEAKRLRPDSAEPELAAVSMLTSLRQFAAAGQRIDALARAHPDAPVAQELRGELALAMDDLPRAQEAFARLVALPGAQPSAYKNLAAVLVARKSLPDALAVLDRGEKAWPADTTLADARAEWLGRAGRTDEAIAVYERTLVRAPGDEIAANNLAYVLAQSKRDKPSLDRALQIANRFATSGQPGYVDTLGLVQYRLGQYEQAAAVLARAATMAPSDPSVQLHYGMALYKKGDVQQGGEIVRKALASKVALPDHDEAQALLARG